MPFNLSQWRTMPISAALGIGLWAVSWLWFLFYIYYLTQDFNWVFKLAVAIVLLAVFILRANNWARMIALMSNAMAILFLAFLAYAFSIKSSLYLIIVVVNIIIFGLASFYLFLPATADFFKSHNPINRENK